MVMMGLMLLSLALKIKHGIAPNHSLLADLFKNFSHYWSALYKTHHTQRLLNDEMLPDRYVCYSQFVIVKIN
jgi:hypothetical protein